MKIRGTVRERQTKIGLLGTFASLEMAQFIGKEVELEVTVIEKPQETKKSPTPEEPKKV